MESCSPFSAYQVEILHFTKPQSAVQIKLLGSQNTLPLTFFFSPAGPLLSSALTMKTTVKVALWLGNIICPAKLRMFCYSAFHCQLLYLKREAAHQTGRSQTILVFIDQYQTFKMHPEIWRHLVQSTKLSFCIFPQIFMLVLVSKLAWGVTTFRVPCSKIISIL